MVAKGAAAPVAGSLAYLGVKATNDELFDVLLIKSPLVLIAWALLAFVPRWKYSQPLAKAIGLFFAVLYVLLMVDGMVFHPMDIPKTYGPKFSTLLDLFSSLEGVHKLFSDKGACFGGWVHYVVFDLWAGIWISNDAIEKGFPLILLPVVLFLTMMLGPSGLFTYFLLKFFVDQIKKLFGAPATKKD